MLKVQILSVFTFLLSGVLAFAETPEVLTAPMLPEGVSGPDMVFQWMSPQILAAEQKWRETYEALKTPEQIAEYQKNMKANFIQAIGGFPTERTPLNAQITGKIEREGFTMEKVLFESQPGMFVTAILYLPNNPKFTKPYSGVVVACGHSYNGKGYVNYQRVAALHALNGIAALLCDPIDQGERFQHFNRETKKPITASVHAHNIVGRSAILLGWNTARFEIWDLMRAFDYMQTRDDIRHDNLGMAGLSGGGTQTSYVMALEDRVKVAATCCYTCNLMGLMKDNNTQDAEQNIFGQTQFGMDHADYCLMRAPKPTLFGTATRDFFPIEMGWQSFRDSKRMYQRMGFGEYVDLAETDNSHGYDEVLRVATVRFMLRFLENREEAINETPMKTEVTNDEILVTPEGFTLLLPGSRTTYDLNRDYARELKAQRQPITAETLPQIRDLTRVRASDALNLKVVSESEVTNCADGVNFQKMLFESEPGIYLPALRFTPAGWDGTAPLEHVLFVSDAGKAADFDTDILPLVKEGKAVLSVELRGYGESQSFEKSKGKYYPNEYLGTDGKEFYVAYNLGMTYVGLRTDDLFAVTRWLKARSDVKSVELYAVSQAGIPALHAAALEREWYTKLTLRSLPASWTETVENGETSNLPLVSTVHGALRVYDLPELCTWTNAVLK